MIKFPTLFGKIPRYQKFSYAPRFYDAKKEEQEAREARIRMELDLEKKEDQGFDLRTRMAGSFQRARKISKSQPAAMSPVMMRLGINLALVVLLIAWLQWGNQALYMLVLIVPVYAWFRIMKK